MNKYAPKPDPDATGPQTIEAYEAMRRAHRDIPRYEWRQLADTARVDAIMSRFRLAPQLAAARAEAEALTVEDDTPGDYAAIAAAIARVDTLAAEVAALSARADAPRVTCAAPHCPGHAAIAPHELRAAMRLRRPSRRPLRPARRPIPEPTAAELKPMPAEEIAP